jgi:hypothetical protein
MNDLEWYLTIQERQFKGLREKIFYNYNRNFR